MRLPDGYETVVGTGSARFRVANSSVFRLRALLLDPTILILDEATAHGYRDGAPDTGRASKADKGKTTITIAHRLSTLKDCNYLFAIENGEIAERGTCRADGQKGHTTGFTRSDRGNEEKAGACSLSARKPRFRMRYGNIKILFTQIRENRWLTIKENTVAEENKRQRRRRHPKLPAAEIAQPLLQKQKKKQIRRQ